MKHNALRKSNWAGENEVAEFIPFKAHINPHTVSTEGGDLMQVIKLDGLAHECADITDLDHAKAQLNSVLRNLARTNEVAIFTHIVRRAVNKFPGGEFHNDFSKHLNEKYERHVTAQTMLVNELYLTVILRPSAIKRGFKGLFRKLETSVEVIQQQRQDALTRLDGLSGMMLKSLEKYGARLLSTYQKDSILHSEILELFSFILNGGGDWKPRAVPRENLKHNLAYNRVFFGADTYEVRTLSTQRFGAILTVGKYPEETFAGYLNVLLSTPFPLIITQSFNFLKESTAKDLILRQQNRMENAGDMAVSQIEAMDAGLDDLASSRLLYGEHHITINIPADSIKQLQNRMQAVEGELANTSLTIAREDWAIMAAYYSQLPGNFAQRPRPSPLSSRNFIAFSSFHNYPTGRFSGNQWGYAVSLLKTTSGAPYYFNFHLPLDAAKAKKREEMLMAGNEKAVLEAEAKEEQKALGNTIIIGPAGSGKTVLQGFLLAQSDKFGAKQFIFDKDRGLELFVRASGGSYLPLKNGERTGFNPFKRLPINEENTMFLQDLVAKCCGGEITPNEELEIRKAVVSVLRLPVELRKISACLSYIDPTVENGLFDRLSKWCADGSLAWVFDNDDDLVDLSGVQKFGFDVTDFLENPTTRTPIVMYIFHLIKSQIDGSRVQVFLDEFWKLLQDKYFIFFVEDELRTIRKKNGILVMGTQSAGEGHKSPIADAIREQTATMVFFPNPKAEKADYLAFGLTEREFELIRHEILPGSREFLIKQGHTSVVAKLDLHGFSDELAIISGTTDNVELVEKIRAEVGDDPKDWVPLFHQRRNLQKETSHEAVAA
ncbi:MAG: Type IV secretion system protein virB4 [Bacteroides sp.]